MDKKEKALFLIRQAMSWLGEGKDARQVTPSEFLELSGDILSNEETVLSLGRIAYDLARWREKFLEEYTSEGAPAP